MKQPGVTTQLQPTIHSTADTRVGRSVSSQAWTEATGSVRIASHDARSETRSSSRASRTRRPGRRH
jgi:hypothetical protein